MALDPPGGGYVVDPVRTYTVMTPVVRRDRAREGSDQVTTVGRNPLFEAADQAARSFPVSWQREPGRIVGSLVGRNGTYAIIMTAKTPALFDVRIAIVEQPRPDARAQFDLLCMSLNHATPTASYCVSSLVGAPVQSIATIALSRAAEIDPMLVRNALRQCVRNAELIAPVIRAINEGAGLADVPMHRQGAYVRLCSAPDGLPDYLANEGPPPAADARLIDECHAAASGAGWEALRRAPGQLAVVCVASPSNGPVYSFVEVHQGSLVVSAYPLGPERDVPAARRPAVAHLLNRILDRGVPFSLSLDLEHGAVLSRCFLDLNGLAEIPPHASLCDMIFQASAGAISYLEAIGRVAFEGVDPERALAEQEAKNAGMLRDLDDGSELYAVEGLRGTGDSSLRLRIRQRGGPAN
jgi:hypothetical protein